MEVSVTPDEGVDEKALDELVFIPCWLSPHKQDQEPPTDGDHRLRMIELAIQDLPWASVSSWELNRSQASFSWQTAEHFRRGMDKSDELFWIIGMDQWKVIERWGRIDYLSTLVEFIVFPRNGQSPTPKDSIPARFLDDAMDISSTKIRTQQAQGLSIANEVTPAVADYMIEKALYQAS